MIEQAKKEHTKTPWETCGPSHIMDGNKKYICSFYDVEGEYFDNSEANAAYIVKACNGYGKLVEALKAAIQVLKSYKIDTKILEQALSEAGE